MAQAAAMEAYDLSSNQDKISQEKNVIAVTITAEGPVIITQVRGGVLTKVVRDAVGESAITQVRGQQGVHAELKGIMLARDLGLTPIAIGVSRGVCAPCLSIMLQNTGIPIWPISPNTK